MIYDKRKLKRYDIFLIVEFKPLRSRGGFSVGITRDLSPNGFSLESQTIECKRGDILEFRLKHPDAEWTVDLSGEVIWRNNSWYKYVIGIKFLQVNEEQNTKILKLMSVVRDEAIKSDLNGKDTESIQETEKVKHSEPFPVDGAIDHRRPDTRITKSENGSLRGAEHSELTDTERYFIAGDAVGINIAESAEEIKPARDHYDSDKGLKAALIKNKESYTESGHMPVDQALDRTTRTDIIDETDAEHEKISAAHINTSYRGDAAQAASFHIHPAENSRKKKLWLYVPLVMVVIIILAIALPVMIEKFNHTSVDFIPVLTESTDNKDIAKDRDIPAADNVQMSSETLNELSVPAPVQQADTKDAVPAEKNRAVNFHQASAVEDSIGINQPKSIVKAEVKSNKAEDTIPPAQIEKTIKITPQMSNANISKPEASSGSKPLLERVEKKSKIDIITEIDETLKDFRAMQNEKPAETAVVIETKKTPEDKPIVKTEEKPLTSQVVKLEEIPVIAAVPENETTPEVKPEVKAPEEIKGATKKVEQSVKRPEMPIVALLVKRDKFRSSTNNSPANKGITPDDLIKKWKHIGSTKSGVPLFIAPDNISYPDAHVVNLLVKASVNKKDFIDLLAINCSQIKIRILEERNGNNPVFSPYSNEWKDIIPDSMILYNSACPEKK